ncbi:MAG TPA: hypothetical protein VH986_03650 [Acidimicrobiia bacterium]|jgi:hypothetical protein
MKWLRRLLGMGALAAVGFAAWRAYDRRRVDSGLTWDPQPFPYPPQPHAEPRRAAPRTTPIPRWIEADAGACPASHPVKAKLTSGIFHVPGGSIYERTQADRCYVNAEAATQDGLRVSKR